MLADRDRGDARPNLADDARTLVAEDGRKQPLRIEPAQRVGVGVTDARHDDFDQHLTGARSIEVNLDDFERRLGREGNGGAGLHGGKSPGSQQR